MTQAEKDVRLLFTEAGSELGTIKNHLTQVRTLYDGMTKGVQEVYDILKRKGDLEKEINAEALTQFAHAANAFGTEIWTTIADMRTDQDGKHAALTTGGQRLKEGVEFLHDHLARAVASQQEWNAHCESWAKEQADATAAAKKAAKKAKQKILVITSKQKEIEEEAAKEKRLRERREQHLMDRVLKKVQHRLKKGKSVDNRTIISEVREENEGLGEPMAGPPDSKNGSGYTTPTESPSGSPSPPPSGGAPKGKGKGRGSGPPKGPKAPIDPPSPSSSSSSSDTDSSVGSNISAWLHRRQQAALKKIKKKELTRLLLGKLFQPTPAPVKKPQIARPEKYDGERKTSFKAWWIEMKRWMRFYAESLQKDTDKIDWVGFQLTGTARRWFQAREKQLESYHQEDTWKEFTEALIKRYVDPKEAEKDHKKIKALEYKGDIKDYITRLRDLNTTVLMSGPAYRDVVKAAVPKEMLKMVYSRSGGIPQEDEEFLAAVTEAGEVIEDMKEDDRLKEHAKKDSEKSSHKKESVETKKDKKKKGDTPTSDKKKKDSSDSKKKETKKKESIFQSGKEALEGVSQDEIDRHKTSKADCIRCGRDGHKMYDCYAKATTNGVQLPDAKGKGKVSAVTSKRKRSDESAKETAALPTSESSSKKQKVAAVREDDEAMSQAPRIWEMDSDESEMDF
jgi:hypothetical protein